MIDDQAAFINMYIQRLVTEITELTKTRLLLETKEIYKEASITELTKKLEELETLSAKEKDDVAQIWKGALTEKDEEVVKIQHDMADLRRKLDVKTNEAASLVISNSEYVAKIAELRHEKATAEDVIREQREELEALVKKPNSKNPPSDLPLKAIKKKGAYTPSKP